MRIVDERKKELMGDIFDFGIDIYPFDFDPKRLNHEIKFNVKNGGQESSIIGGNAIPTDMSLEEAIQFDMALREAIEIARLGIDVYVERTA